MMQKRLAACHRRELVNSFTCFMGHLKLHIPGPTEVSDKTFEAFRTPMIGPLNTRNTIIPNINATTTPAAIKRIERKDITTP